MSAAHMMDLLNKEKIDTWFDLGIFIDRFREEKPYPAASYHQGREEFKQELEKTGLAFITFSFSVDGVSNEIEKYAKVFRMSYPGISVHYLAGEFYPESYKLIHPETRQIAIKEAGGFDKWPLYRDFFFTRLERGSGPYNRLIKALWKEIRILCRKIGGYIEKNNISLLIPVNVCSNPGNVSLAISIALVSEYLGIPVINNCHDFFWEGGNRPEDIQNRGLKKGPRDFFFTNAHLGEVFSLVEMFYPWESRNWLTVNINRQQTEHVIRVNGHNPANVMEIGTAIDLEEYTNTSKRTKINTFYQFEQVLSRYRQILVSYSVEDVLNNKLVDESNIRPILISGQKTRPIKNFLAENMVFLQPTRIIARKRIEWSFRLIRELFHHPDFTSKFSETENLKLTLLVTGPVALGHYSYLEKLIDRFARLVNNIPEGYRDKIYLAFLFSELDREHFKKRFAKPVGIAELYNIASLVLLPSKTEGRGLPIIEAMACGVPIFCRRYEPQNVYAEVIGEHLPEADRLKVIEFEGKEVTDNHIERIISRIFFPHLHQEETLHNQAVVRRRYSLESLKKTMDTVIERIWRQMGATGGELKGVKNIAEKYRKQVFFRNHDLKKLLREDHRQYLPGFGKMSFMIFLKSLIDPSYFRVEEQYFRGALMQFARELVEDDPAKEEIPEDRIVDFYNSVDSLFHLSEGSDEIGHDHSFAYRHRNNVHYFYRDYTFQELTGIVNRMYVQFIRSGKTMRVVETAHFFTDWNLALTQLTSSTSLAIDDRAWLFERMKANVPIVIFAGRYVSHELEFFALQSIRSRLKLALQDELTRDILEKKGSHVTPVYVFAQKNPVRNWPDVAEIEKFIRGGRSGELKLLHEFGLVRIVPVSQWSLGIHIPQLGSQAIRILREVRDQEGFLITHRKDAVVMSDILDMDRVHIGRVEDPVTEGMMGIPAGSGFIIRVPAGLRMCLSYPVPVQTAKEFHEALNGPLFRELAKKHGEEWLMAQLKADAETRGSPLADLLEKLSKPARKKREDVSYEWISGLYDDGNPWSGVMARIRAASRGRQWQFMILDGNGKTRRVTEFAGQFEKNYGKIADIAWNGGYILNAELVGKLGLPESYIGSPLGLIISGGKILCPPLFNKPAFQVGQDGKLHIGRVSLLDGLSLSDGESELVFRSGQRNPESPGNEPCFYDLMHQATEIEGNGRLIIRMAGNRIMEIIRTGKGEHVRIIPVGLSLSFPPDQVPGSWLRAKTLEIRIPGLEQLAHAIEAGPLLLEDGKPCIDMEKGGWKTGFSIATQAARIDYTHLRGPKIAAGLDQDGNLTVLAVNGRIRESVGATHGDMARILQEQGMREAMGFDPGGSSTLVVQGKVLNISPYHPGYQQNVFSLPPEPRAVSNAVIGYRQ